MATVTPNFNWPVPTSTDLVKDGATAIEALGDSIDASLVDLKGGTTGQVLSKTSNTDMDFTWVAQDDSNAIQNTIVDAKGDLIAASAADTPARLAVGNNGETLVADSSTTTGLRWQGDYAAGKNKIINGAFDHWQRGTTVTMTSGTYFLADRFSCYVDTVSGTTTYSQQTFTPGTAPVSGYEGTYFARVSTGGSLNLAGFTTKLEDVRVLAGQTVTLSFWMKTSTAKTFTLLVRQDFGTGGSAAVDFNATYTTSTSWQRFTFTTTLGSLTGKTIGTNSCLIIQPIAYSNHSTSFTADIWGVQVEASNTATAFQTATGTLQGELAACQRYYYRQGGVSTEQILASGFGYNSTTSYYFLAPPVTMRKEPSVVDYASIANWDGVTTGVLTNISIDSALTSTSYIFLAGTFPSGGTQYRPQALFTNSTLNGYLGISAEL